ncbi:right-handed parallel beta-helix repeat-containing protein [Nitrosospira sp. Is2]|uniref:right-handed parallel beta-helix repeat-containing protein n=1 Tax=Nitrosospira sp. Is2 TaxID=3080532 RepID=UPI002954FB39|nr:right-handed parallel beta-helix repeat-containing protein [Nitrosospira sp. Is2]WON72615.1 right-handed parallel beta-helix repeat-containing protein [Nitrosospira sp. Is2]
MGWIAVPFSHLVSFDACVITQFGLALEEELNVKTNKQPPKSVSGQHFFWLFIARQFAVIRSRLISRRRGTDFARLYCFEKAWAFAPKFFKSRERHEAMSNFHTKRNAVSGVCIDTRTTSSPIVCQRYEDKKMIASTPERHFYIPRTKKIIMNIIKKLIVIFILATTHQYAHATTYYIDSELGNDMWSGKMRAKTAGNDGPWQSLNRLTAATLSPGDVVELQCGSKWIQTLRLKSSGTPELPITIRSASSACSTPPSIEGSQRIDAHGWAREGDAIFNSSWPVQKFQNGTLAAGVEGWTSWSASSDQKLVYENNCPDSPAGCAAFTTSMKPGSIAISNNFLVEAGVSYNGAITLRIPKGIKVAVLVRRGSAPYEPISAVYWITGNGSWQKSSFAFTTRSTISNARLDIEVQSEGVKLHFKDTSLKAAFMPPLGAWIGDLPLLPAYHPNRGHDTERPDSVYAVAASDANAVRTPYGGAGSTYLEIDSDLKLPQGVMPRPGNRLRIRSAPWRIDEVTITSISGNRLNFTPATSYPIRKGHGYFLLDATGTLDSPGEWLYDANKTSVSIWTPEGNDPAGQIRLSVLEKGIDLSNRSNIILQGINLRRTGLGIDLTNAKNITIKSVGITDTVGQGIFTHNSSQVNITTNRILRTGGDAISSFTSKALRVTGNDISESAVTIIGDRVWSLPAPTQATVQAGSAATITDNRISRSGGNGIWTLADGNIEKNAVLHSCLLLNDCGGIYVNVGSPNTRIASNLVEQVYGNADGVIDTRIHSVGIYLDDLSTNMKIESNSVAWAEFGIQVHNSYKNNVSSNMLFGNRQFQILMQEQTKRLRANGDIYGNSIDDNTLIPTTPVIGLMKQSSIGETGDFGTFERNHYSALLSSRVIGQSDSNEPYTELRFEEWQATSAIANMARDASGKVHNPVGYAATKITGVNIVPNGNLVAGNAGWSTWNQTAPLGKLSFQNCDLVGPCLYRSEGASDGLLSSPNFSIKGNVWYRVTFDIRTDEVGQPFEVLIRRDGWGTNLGYETLMGKPQSFTGNRGWKRYSFTFKTTKSITAGDPMTGERGARVDFQKIPAGKSLYIANLEIVPIAALESALSLRRISNPGRNADDISCPDEVSAPEACANYVRFSDQQPVSWPVNLPPLGTEIFFTRDPSLVDSDADGVADIQDKCSQTSAGEITDAAGCALGQSPG